MKNTNVEPLRLDAFHNQNWEISSGPVAVLNEVSSTHERIAFCWGLSAQIQTIAHIISTSDDVSLWRFGQLLNSFSTPLEKMLERLGNDTDPRDGGPT